MKTITLCAALLAALSILLKNEGAPVNGRSAHPSISHRSKKKAKRRRFIKYGAIAAVATGAVVLGGVALLPALAGPAGAQAMKPKSVSVVEDAATAETDPSSFLSSVGGIAKQVTDVSRGVAGAARGVQGVFDPTLPPETDPHTGARSVPGGQPGFFRRIWNALFA